jgi:hypothetical protein
VTSPSSRRLWLTAGLLLVGYVVLTFGSAAFQQQLTLGDSPSRARSALVTSSMTKTFAGGYLELLASLVLLVAALLLARLLRGSDETSRWLASCVGATAVVAVAVQIATGGAAGAAAVYEGHHGASLSTVTAIDDLRVLGFALTSAVVGVMVAAASAAAHVTGALPRRLVQAGYLVGIVCVAGVPAARAGEPQVLLFYAWLLATGIVALRRGRADDSAVAVRTAVVTSA